MNFSQMRKFNDHTLNEFDKKIRQPIPIYGTHHVQ
jgi:hypothetical protein